MGLDNRKVVAFVERVEFSGKGYERTFWGQGNSLYFDWCHMELHVKTYQNAHLSYMSILMYVIMAQKY